MKNPEDEIAVSQSIDSQESNEKSSNDADSDGKQTPNKSPRNKSPKSPKSKSPVSKKSTQVAAQPQAIKKGKKTPDVDERKKFFFCFNSIFCLNNILKIKKNYTCTKTTIFTRCQGSEKIKTKS